MPVQAGLYVSLEAALIHHWHLKASQAASADTATVFLQTVQKPDLNRWRLLKDSTRSAVKTVTEFAGQRVNAALEAALEVADRRVGHSFCRAVLLDFGRSHSSHRWYSVVHRRGVWLAERFIINRIQLHRRTRDTL